MNHGVGLLGHGLGLHAPWYLIAQLHFKVAQLYRHRNMQIAVNAMRVTEMT
jgi:hypothetical protein